MNKNETESLWRALCACTCKPGTRAPFDSVCVHDRSIYATNSYVLHRVEGLYNDAKGNIFKALHGHDCAYIDSVRVLDSLLEYEICNHEMMNMCKVYDPKLFALALRPHRALDATVTMHAGKRTEQAPLILTSAINTPAGPIQITTAVQGKRLYK